ncbi:MAG: PKD domain-containing protein [Bacteroidales bacterium]
MKKLLLPILFLLLVLPAISQNLITITGTVTDNVSGAPIPNHAVVITNDSTGGWIYYQTVYTDINGIYFDSVSVPAPAMGVINVRTMDCQNYYHQIVLTYQPAVMNFTADFSICYNSIPCVANYTTQQSQPLALQFIDASTGGQNLRNWIFGDGSSSNELNPLHIYPQPGYYTVTLEIGAPGTPCYDALTQPVYVWDSNAAGCHAAYTVYPDTSGTGYTFHFADQSTGNIISWEWNFDDPWSGVNNTSTLQNPTHTYADPRVYRPCLTIHGADSTCYDIICDTLIIGTQPACHAAFTYYTDSVNTPNTVHFVDLSTGNIVNWEWNFGDGGTSNLQNPVHVYPQAGTYVVTLTVGSPNQACFDTMTQTIIVTAVGQGCHADYSYVCFFTNFYTLYFTDLSTGNPTSWMWSFGDGTSSNIQNPQHSYSGPGTYSVCLTITGDSCTNTICKNIVVSDTVLNHQIYGQVFAGNFPINLGMAMIFSIDTTGSYQPYVATCPIDSSGIYYFTSVPTGSYYILAIPFDSNGYLPTYYGNTTNWEAATLVTLGTENNPYNINLVSAIPMNYGPGSAGGQINMGGLKTAMLDKINMILYNDMGQAVGFTQVSVTGTFSFPSLAYGTYYLHPEMPGITSETIMIVISAEKPHADVVMTFSGNKILGVRDESTLANRWLAYPNPVSDNLTISIDMKKEVTAQIGIYNLTGLLVSNTAVTLNSGSNTIGVHTGSLPSGIYSVRINSTEGLILTTKIVKTR